MSYSKKKDKKVLFKIGETDKKFANGSWLTRGTGPPCLIVVSNFYNIKSENENPGLIRKLLEKITKKWTI